MSTLVEVMNLQSRVTQGVGQARCFEGALFNALHLVRRRQIPDANTKKRCNIQGNSHQRNAFLVCTPRDISAIYTFCVRTQLLLHPGVLRANSTHRAQPEELQESLDENCRDIAPMDLMDQINMTSYWTVTSKKYFSVGSIAEQYKMNYMHSL